MNNIEIFLPVAYKIATVVWIQNTVDFEERRKEKTEQLKSINTEKFCMTQTFFLIHYSLYIIWTACERFGKRARSNKTAENSL